MKELCRQLTASKLSEAEFHRQLVSEVVDFANSRLFRIKHGVIKTKPTLLFQEVENEAPQMFDNKRPMLHKDIAIGTRVRTMDNDQYYTGVVSKADAVFVGSKEPVFQVDYEDGYLLLEELLYSQVLQRRVPHDVCSAVAAAAMKNNPG